MKNTLLMIFVLLLILVSNSKSAFAQQVKSEGSTLLNEATSLLTTSEEDLPSIDNVDLAITKLENVIKLEPRYYEAYVKLGIAYRIKRAWLDTKAETIDDANIYEEKSRVVLQKAIDMAPNRPQAYHEYLAVADNHDSKKIVNRLYELEPNDPEVMYYKGYDLIEEGKVEEGTPLVLKGMRGVSEIDIWGKKDELAKVLKRKGYAKKADEITRSVNNERKYHDGKMQLMYHDVDNGLRLIKESVAGDLNKLDVSQKTSVAKELENRQRFKDAAQMLELIDPIKYRDHIRDLKKKSGQQTD
jgi:hypothetical protein